MEPETKKHKFLPVLATILIMLLLAGGIGAGVWYYMDQRTKSEMKTFTERLDAAAETIRDLRGTNESETITKSPPTNLTDEDYLKILTINKVTDTNEIVAPKIVAKEGSWAKTVPVPVLYSETAGYSVPGRGGQLLIWHKVNGVWTFVGQGTEGGWDDAVKAALSEIPTTIIPAEGRE